MMKLQFRWTDGPDGRWASAEEAGVTGVSPLACLLMDDGGVDRQSSLAWLQEGIARVDTVLSGTKPGPMDWDREAWGAVLQPDKSTVHSLLDDACSEVMPTSMFRRALVEWMNFLVAGTGPVVLDLD